ncbi:unnamed protein product [Polarella glacialis]|uniref:Uncharacterized protein n=1 Tax=Polarella glacialis TaxID=89957 RepID=A0A813HNI7_POLGL|nr:unnamed protein product [Polarella glacialis]
MRPRLGSAAVSSAVVAPDLTGLWRNMSSGTRVAEGVGLALLGPGLARPRPLPSLARGRVATGRTGGPPEVGEKFSQLREAARVKAKKDSVYAHSRSRRAVAVGTCHAWTAAGAPCRCAGQLRPQGANYVYCRTHSAKWARFESVSVQEIRPKATAKQSEQPRPKGVASAPSLTKAAVPQRRAELAPASSAAAPQSFLRHGVPGSGGSGFPRAQASVALKVKSPKVKSPVAKAAKRSAAQAGLEGSSAAPVGGSQKRRAPAASAGMLSGLSQVIGLLP